MVVRRYIPPSSSTKESLFALCESNKQRWRIMDPPVERSPELPLRLMRSVSQPIEPIQTKFCPLDVVSSHSDGSSGFGAEEFKSTHIRRGSEPLLPLLNMPKSSISDAFGMQSPAKHCEEQVDEKLKAKQEHGLNGIESHEHFPMGSRDLTLPELGWLDLACAPSINIDVIYQGHNSDVSHENKPDGKMIPNVVKVAVDVPSVLFRVFGCIVRDLIGLRVSEISKSSVFARRIILIFLFYKCIYIYIYVEMYAVYVCVEYFKQLYQYLFELYIQIYVYTYISRGMVVPLK